ncbi:MAG: WXG100 family type VII secretion target [Butyrivibrio sp.]|jgi:WXG100 family type VII secretion target|nr:WXG100 family type VII secretion target [Butyrivibrio sp.]MCR4635054.1 WXG100 family type VII secretion target [Butyrivibrio sp.]
MANQISLNTKKLLDQAQEFSDYADELTTLLDNLNDEVNTLCSVAVFGESAPSFLSQYTAAEEAMRSYVTKLHSVGERLTEAANTGKEADGSLIDDVSISVE